MGKKTGRTRHRNSAVSGPRKFTSPTPEHEDLFFTWGMTKDTVKFKDTISQLYKA